MNWKDWLYIPKGDKIAIVSLAIVIVILLVISLLLRNRNNAAPDLVLPTDYEEWKSQLIEKKLEEQQSTFEKYRASYPDHQPKMKIGETIELNSADTTLLKMIPGIGTGYANRMVNYRNSLGGYARIEQLGEVWGMDTYLYSQVIPYLTLNVGHDSIFINSDSFEQLLKHPYLNYKQVMAIDDIRTRKAKIVSIKRLELLDEFSKRDIERLIIYASFK